MAYVATIDNLDGTTTPISLADGGIRLSLNHSAMSECELEIKPVDSVTDLAFGDLDVDLDGAALFRGEVVEPMESFDAARGTVMAVGPGYELTREAPTSEVTYTDEWRYNAIDDYVTNHLDGISASWTTYQPTPAIREDDAQIEDIPAVDSFDNEFSVGSDVPIDIQPSTKIALQQHAFFGTEGDFTGTFTTDDDQMGDSYFHIDSDWAIVDSAGESVTFTDTINHDIPAERVAGAIHYKVNSATSSVDDTDFSINGTRVGFDNFSSDFDPVSGNMEWKVFDGQEYSNAGGGDLTAGNSYSVTFDIDAAGDYEIDCMGFYDTDYPPTTFDEPANFDDDVDGPGLFPADVELTSIQHFENGNVQEVRLDTAWNNTDNEQRISASVDDGGTYLNANNTQDTAFDFDGNGLFGGVVRTKIRLSGTDTGNTWLAENAAGQEITDYKLSVTVDDRQIIDDLTLRSSHFDNLKDLHGGSWRFVVDPRVRSPITAESFRKSRNGASKSDTWRTITSNLTRDVRNYGNQVLFIYTDSTAGTFDSVTVRDPTEVTAKDNTVIQSVTSTTESLSDTEAHARALNELADAIAIDDIAGTERAAAEFILPGYEYSVPKWNRDASIERVTYTERAGTAEMSLQFTRDRDLTAVVIDNKGAAR